MRYLAVPRCNLQNVTRIKEHNKHKTVIEGNTNTLGKHKPVCYRLFNATTLTINLYRLRRLRRYSEDALHSRVRTEIKKIQN